MSERPQSDMPNPGAETSLEPEMLRATGTDGASYAPRGHSLKELAAASVAAHRQRRSAQGGAAPPDEETARLQAEAHNRIPARRSPDQDDAAARVREAVAARYRESQSYREYVALESARALERAQAEAEVAQRRADAMAEAQAQLMKELEAWRSETSPVLPAVPTLLQPTLVPSLPAVLPIPRSQALAPIEQLRVRLFEELPALAGAPAEPPLPTPQLAAIEQAQEEMAGLELEIEFRLAPDFADHRIETVPIQANIIEFPRELVAPRKARPRLAEGPLREDVPGPAASAAEAISASSQLRIFEVAPVSSPLEGLLPFAEPAGESLSTVPDEFARSSPVEVLQQVALEGSLAAAQGAATDGALSIAIEAPGWQGVLPAEAPARLPETWPEHWLDAAPSLLMPVYAAGIDRRLMSALVDTCCITAGWLSFLTMFCVICGEHLPHLPAGLIAGGLPVSVAAVAWVYHWLFFTYGQATPGMLYARVGLCTFAETSPTRRQRQARVWSLLLAMLPLGWGLISMAFEIDHLGWHDKRSKMYPREY